MIKFVFGTLLVIAILNYTESADFLTEQPDYVIKCRFADSNYVSCFTESVRKWYNKLAHEGISSVPPVDPYYIKNLKLTPHAGNSAANLNAEFNDMKVEGLKDANLKESKINLPDKTWDTKVIIPKLHIEGNYKLDGNILLVPLNGEGKMTLDLDDVKVGFRSISEHYKIDDFHFFNVSRVVIKRVQIGGMKTYLHNLFNGNKELEEATNSLLNESWQDFYEALKPTLYKTIEELMLDVYKSITAHIPMNFMIEDIGEHLE